MSNQSIIWNEFPERKNITKSSSKFTTIYDTKISFELLDKIKNYLVENDENKLFDKRIWTIDDVVTFTGIAKQTVYNMASKDEIPHRKRAGKLYFLPDEILSWIDEGDE